MVFIADVPGTHRGISVLFKVLFSIICRLGLVDLPKSTNDGVLGVMSSDLNCLCNQAKQCGKHQRSGNAN